MHQLVMAFVNSSRALTHLARNEKAVQQELLLFVLSIPLAALTAPSAQAFLLLTGSLFLIMVEVINTGIEAACDAVSGDFRHEIQIAKDCGSLAVLICIVLVGMIWLYTLWHVVFP